MWEVIPPDLLLDALSAGGMALATAAGFLPLRWGDERRRPPPRAATKRDRVTDLLWCHVSV
jgi:hypothetical protein